MEEEGRISRRELLKKAGIVGAVAWSAPVLSSLPAHATTDRHRDPCLGNCINCPSQGTVPACPKDPANCFCFWHYKNGPIPKCFCADLRPGNGFCSDYPTCNTNADCLPLGRTYKCASTCCDVFGLPPICLAKCDKFSAAPKRPSSGRGPRVYRGA